MRLATKFAGSASGLRGESGPGGRREQAAEEAAHAVRVKRTKDRAWMQDICRTF